MAHIHRVIDDDKHFIVNPDTRTITFAGETLPTLIQFDHNSERFTFEIPPEIDGHDMTLCNKVQIHFININKDNPEEFNPSIYESTDLGPNDEGDKLIFTWLIDQSATLLAGPLNFALRFMCTSEEENEDGEIEVVLDYSWNTHPHEGVSVSNGFDNNEILSNKYYEVVDQWYATIEGAAIVARDEALAKISEAKTSALNNIEQSFDHLTETEQEVLGHITGAQSSAVKLIQNTETKAIDNIDEHAESAMENWSNTNAGKDILSQVTALREEVANLADNTTLCKPGVLYGRHAIESNNNRFMNGHGNSNKSYYLIGDNGGPFIISHDYGTKPLSIRQVILLRIESSNGGVELQNMIFEWLYPIFESDIPSGMTYSYSSGVGYIDEEDNTFYGDLTGAKTVEYPTESVFVIEPGKPYVTFTGNASKYASTSGEHLTVELVSPIFLGDKRWRAVRQVSVNDITRYDMEQDMSGTLDVIVEASYLIIAPTVNTNFTIRQCSSGTSEFTLKANGIAAIEGPVEHNFEDTYTIVLDDGTTKSFTVPNGNSAGIRTKVSGEIVRCDDVIDVEHTVKVTARSKNLIPFSTSRGYVSSITNATITLRGVTYTIDSNGSITCKGTTSITDGGNGFSSFELVKASTWTALKDGVTYYLGGSQNLLLAYKDASGVTKYIHGGQSDNNPFTWSDDYTFVSLYIQHGSLNVAKEVDEVISPYLYIDDGVSRAFTPYVGVDGTIIKRIGKNMVPYPHSYGTGTIAGVTYTANSDGTVIATGTAVDASIQYLISGYMPLAPGTYTISGCPAGGSQSTYRLCIKTNHATPVYYYDTGAGRTFTIDENINVQLYIYVGNGVTVDNLVFKPQLEVGSSATGFESYSSYVTDHEINSEGKIYSDQRIRSISPTMTLFCDQNGIIIDAEYNRDYSALSDSTGGSYDETALESLNADVESLERRVDAIEKGAGNSGGSTPYDCSSGLMGGSYDTTKYVKITVPNTSTILDLTIKQDIDAGGAQVGQYDFITWRLHLKGNMCSGQCSTIIQDATTEIPTLYYTTDDEFIYIYFGYMGESVEAYINGILENILAEFEVVDSLPGDVVEFAMNGGGLEDRVTSIEESIGAIEQTLTSIIELQESYIGGDA